MRSLAAEVVNVGNEESSVDGWGNGASWARRDARTVLRGIGIPGRGGRIGKVVVTAMGSEQAASMIRSSQPHLEEFEKAWKPLDHLWQFHHTITPMRSDKSPHLGLGVRQENAPLSFV